MARKAMLPNQNELEERILSICRRLEKLFGLEWQDLAHIFNSGDGEESGTACTTTSKWQYRVGRLVWNLDAMISQTDENIEEIAVHEYVHILLGPIQEYLPDDTAREEFATESIARVIIKIMRQGDTIDESRRLSETTDRHGGHVVRDTEPQ